MKIAFLLLPLCLLTTAPLPTVTVAAEARGGGAPAAAPSPSPLNGERAGVRGESSTPLKVVFRDANSRRWERTVQETLPNGKVRTRTSGYTELGTGLCYPDPAKPGEWLDAKEEIELFQNGAMAMARQGQVQVAFEADFNGGIVDLLAPSGQRFRSRCIGVAYLDVATGNSTLIAEPQRSIGEVAGNQVIYRDAFDGDFQADVLYVYTIAGLEQFVIFRTDLPPPEDFGMRAEDVRVEVWSEMIDPPAPVARRTWLKPQPDAARAQAVVDPFLSDDALDWDSVSIGTGTAFPLAAAPDAPFESQAIPVGKSWTRTPEGRQFLIEKVDYTDLAPHLARLPKVAAVNNQPNQPPRAARPAALPAPSREALFARLRPPVRRDPKLPGEKMRMAAVAPPSPLGGERAGVRGESPRPSDGRGIKGEGAAVDVRGEKAEVRTAALPLRSLGGRGEGRGEVRAPSAAAAVRGEKSEVRTAATTPSHLSPLTSPLALPGLAIDYSIVISQTNMTFLGDTSYFISSAVNLSGTTLF